MMSASFREGNCHGHSEDKSNDPFQKSDPSETKNYNKLFVRFSLAVIVLLLLGLLFVYVLGRHI
jgi:hypothetical protein